jgi:hypothetical protein
MEQFWQTFGRGTEWPELDFRENVALVTYGDDALLTVGPSVPWYNVERLPQLGQRLGIVLTDASKSGVVAARPLAEVQFLKRSFRYDAEFGCFVAAISLKTIAKMLVVRLTGALGERDHAAALLSDALREAVYHGRDFYNRLRERVVEVVRKYELSGEFLQISDFDTHLQEVRSGSFSTWRSVADRKFR